jgi:hypothetical protein
MNPAESDGGKSSHIHVIDASDRVGASIRGHSLNLGKCAAKMFQNSDKVIRLDDQGISVLKEDGFHPMALPGQGRMKCHVILTRKSGLKSRYVAIEFRRLVDGLIDFINEIAHPINILADMIYWADAELLPFVKTTKSALVPGTIARHSKKQAARLTWWPNWAKFKAMVCTVVLILLFHPSFPEFDCASYEVMCSSSKKQPLDV